MRCKYIRKIFQNEENGYTVALFSTLNQEVPLSARDKFWAEKKIIAFTAKGYDLPLTDEIEIEMEGEWETSSYKNDVEPEEMWFGVFFYQNKNILHRCRSPPLKFGNLLISNFGGRK